MHSLIKVQLDGQLIEKESIIWLEGDWNYTRIYQEGQPARLSSYTLKCYERLLVDFIRVRKNAIVNPKYVLAILSISTKPRRLQVVLSTGEQLEITRRRQSLARKQLKQLAQLI